MKNFFLGKQKYSKKKNKVFLKDLDGNSVTFDEFNDYVDYQIDLFKKKKLKESDPLLLMCSNSIRCSIVIFAAAKYGLKLITLSNNSTLLEISNTFNELKPKIIVTFDKSLLKYKKFKSKTFFIENSLSRKNSVNKIKKVSKKGQLIVKSGGTTGIGKNICLNFHRL